MLNIAVEKFADTVILHCAGRIVRGHETALLCTALGQQGRNIILDLEKTDAIDAAGVGALISLHAAGVYLRLINPSKTIRDVLRLTRLDSIFEISSAPLAWDHEERARDKQEKQNEEREDAPLSDAFLSPSAATAI
ncbi:MAG TPA: STAS domain-containing protein [Candidatus Deferrimicrobiaceae bacterium]|jgi:anti-anti-sigma factor|nr:STAS domain-containing protein [Candidatus Deferrimicrobiaceae bacterium]